MIRAGLILFGVWVAQSTAFAIDINGCPAVIPSREVGVLQSDFDCLVPVPSNPYHGIVIENGGALDLNGHTIRFIQTERTFSPVFCDRRCEVYGPGLITSAGGGAGIYIGDHGRAVIHDLTITNVTTGIYGIGAKLHVASVSITARAFGINPVKSLTLDHVDVTLTGDTVGDCLAADRPGRRVKGMDVSVQGCGTGVSSTGRINLTRLTVQNSTMGVVSPKRVDLTDSSVTGSSRADLYVGRLPNLINTSCGSSRSFDDVPWGVCAND